MKSAPMTFVVKKEITFVWIFLVKISLAHFSQAGSENFPLDSSGETISDDTHFLETWEVSQTDRNLKQLTTDVPKPSLGSKDDGHSQGAAKSLRDSLCLSGDGRAGGRRSGQSHWRFKLQQGAD